MAPQASVSTTQERRSPALVSVDGRTYPLRAAHIRGRAEGGIAQTTLIQEFHNPHAEPLEALYTMPLPADGAVLGYTVRIGERVIRGEIEPREKAEAIYREALYQGRTAGLLEQDRPDTFQQRLGNVPPKTDVRVEIDVLHPLAFLAAVDDKGPVWEYRFPTVVGVRYEGVPGRVPDAGRLDVDRGEAGDIPTRFDVNLVVADDPSAGAGITSPSHSIRCIANAVGVHVTLPEDARLDRDLILRWAASTDEVGVRVVEGKGLPGDDGRYAILTITPPRVPAATFHRDLTVLIDASGSMSGEPIETAKCVVVGLLESLEAGDRFEILAFATETASLTKGLEDATPKAVKRAIAAVRALKADGATEMLKAFEAALSSLRRDSQRQIVLVTDGQIGFEKEISKRICGGALPSGVRVHAVGIGEAVNRSLTTLVARGGRGVELIANRADAAEEAAKRLRAATVRPILTEIHLRGSALVASAPEFPRDVFESQPLVVAAELKPEGGTLEVSARLAGSGEVWGWRVEVGTVAGGAGDEGAGGAPAATPSNMPQGMLNVTTLPLGTLYGREAIADVETHGARYGKHSDLDDKIEALGMRHRITSRRTSLVAVAEEPSVDPLAPRRRERLAVELPAGVSAEGVGLDQTMAYMSVARSFERLAMGLSEDSVRLMERFEGESERQLTLAAQLKGVFRLDPAVTGIMVAEVLSFDGVELTVEFNVPEDGFLLPTGEIDVHFRGREATAIVVTERSAPVGPHLRRTRVRLTVQLTKGEKWPEKGQVTIGWTGLSTGITKDYRLVANLSKARRAQADH